MCHVHGVGVFSRSGSNLKTFRHNLEDKNLPVACADDENCSCIHKILSSYNTRHKLLKQEPFVLTFLQISYIHSSHLCSHSNMPLSFPNVEPSVFWSTEMTANSNQHCGWKNHTSVSRFVTSIVERSVKRSSLQTSKSQCSSLNTFGMGQNNNNVDHHTQSVTVW